MKVFVPYVIPGKFFCLHQTNQPTPERHMISNSNLPIIWGFSANVENINLIYMYIDFHLIKELNPVVGENLLVSQMENRGTILS